MITLKSGVCAVAILMLAGNSFAQDYFEGSGFSAPEVTGATNVPNPARGDIILDTTGPAFKGFTGSGWMTFGTGTAGQLQGTSTNDNANAGNVGEEKIQTLVRSSGTTLTVASEI